MRAQRRLQELQRELQLAAAEVELEVWAGSGVGVGTEPKGQRVVLKVEDLRLKVGKNPEKTKKKKP